MSTTRLERWEKPREIMLSLAPGDDHVMSLFNDAWAKRHEHEKFTIGTMIEGARELIFELREGVPIFSVVGYYLDTQNLRLTASLGFEILYDEDRKDFKEHIVYVLGLATAYDVPVYPNTDSDAPILAQYYRDLHLEGMLAPDGEGKKVRLKLTRSPGRKIVTYEYLEELKLTEFHTPAELVLIRDAVREELAKRDEAGRVLQMLRVALDELQALLQSVSRNEHNLQRCLERNPILFGPDYERVIPKHRLGKEYEMDYALVRSTGLIDLAEIESSTLRLFKKKGDPTAELVHAEQQVLDWLDWLERNHAYARESLPGLLQPTGYVIIGRVKTLSSADLRRLVRRNAAFGGRLQIMTYDDLHDRGANLLRLLEGAPHAARDVGLLAT